MKFSLINVACIISTVLSDEICYLPLDVMFLQDTTGSFDDDLPNVLAQIPDMVHTITNDFPESKFGVAEFKDKPYFPLGEANDFCYKLGDGILSSELEDFRWAYSLLYASGGGDLPEATFQALINTASDPSVGWRPLVSGGARATIDQAGARLIILSTDAQPHLPGDIEKLRAAQYPDLPQGLPPNSGVISTGDVDYECIFQDYPSAEQVKNALKQMNIHLVILTPEDPDIVGAWKWVNEALLGQPSSFYQFISADSSDLLSGVLKAVEAVTQFACPTTTTTPTPTATTPAATTQVISAVPSFAPVITAESTVVTYVPSYAPTFTTPAEVSPVGSTETPMASQPDCPEVCPPCPEPRPTPCETPCCCCHCHDGPCNEGVLIVISDKPKHVNITLA